MLPLSIACNNNEDHDEKDSNKKITSSPKNIPRDNKDKEIGRIEKEPMLKKNNNVNTKTPNVTTRKMYKRRKTKADLRFTTKLALAMTVATIIMLFILYIVFNLIPTSTSTSSTIEANNRFLEENDDNASSSSGDCNDIYLVTKEDQCSYAYECDNGNGISFLPNIYCHTYNANTIAFLLSPLLLILLIILFRVLGSTAEDYFSPGLEMFSNKIGLPPRFAGVSLLALGNGCPDVSASANAIRSNPTNGYLLALGALTGAGMFIGCIVSGVVIVVAGGVPCRGALVRDVIMYGLSLFIVYRQLQKGYIDQASIRLFVIMYLSFMLIVLIADLYHRKVVLPRLLEIENSKVSDAATSNNNDNNPSLQKDQAEEQEQEPSNEPIPLRVVRSSLMALSNYSSMESAYLNKDEETPVLHGKDGILAHKNLLRTIHEAQHQDHQEQHQDHSEDYFNYCGESPYAAMVDSVEALEISTWCTTPSDGTNVVSAGNWNNAFIEFKNDSINHWKDYLNGCWDESEHWLEKLLFLLELPAIIARKVTVPVPTDGYYCRSLIALSIMLSPIWISLYILILHQTNVFAIQENGIPIPIFWIFQFIAITIGLSILRYAPGDDIIDGNKSNMSLLIAAPIALYGFLVAATWIDFIADRLVSLLNFLGILLRIPSSIMGLTVLAWGNSMADLSANIAMARRGLANMAMTACYAGPVFNILISLSVGFSALQTMEQTTSTEVHMNPSISTGFIFLFINCFVVLISGLIINNGYIPMGYGYIAVGLYSMYVVSSIVLQLK